MNQIVFVPTIGFRPAGTRLLRERAETTADGTRLMVLAAAAAPGRTDVVIEWERRGDPATCPPDSQLLVHSNFAPLEKGLTAGLVIGTSRRDATAMRRRSLHVSHPSMGAVDVITFPELPDGAERAELRVNDGGTEWRVPLALVPSGLSATALDVELERDDRHARGGKIQTEAAAARFAGTHGHVHRRPEHRSR